MSGGFPYLVCVSILSAGMGYSGEAPKITATTSYHLLSVPVIFPLFPKELSSQSLSLFYFSDTSCGVCQCPPQVLLSPNHGSEWAEEAVDPWTKRWALAEEGAQVGREGGG